MDPRPPLLTRTKEGIRLEDFDLDRIDPNTLTLTHLCAAVDALPGVRIGARGLDPAGLPQLCVEVFDPAVDAWRPLVTFTDGRAWVESRVLEDREGAAYRAAAQLARQLDACFITGEGVVLVWGGDWEEAT
jgi:hypothetical protein